MTMPYGLVSVNKYSETLLNSLTVGPSCFGFGYKLGSVKLS